LSGQVTYSGLIPARGIGVSVLSNVEEGVSSAQIRMTTVASGAVVSAVARAARERAREQPVWAGDEPGDGPPAGVYAGRAR
jgi:hypothetical protein